MSISTNIHSSFVESAIAMPRRFPAKLETAKNLGVRIAQTRKSALRNATHKPAFRGESGLKNIPAGSFGASLLMPPQCLFAEGYADALAQPEVDQS